tara:strand:- start:1667 stop:2482 length:816 start_codon:yes stop_codon:yes gene_type:complete
MDSYFFVPGNRLHKINEAFIADTSYIIIDMEDAIKESDKYTLLKQLEKEPNYKNHFIRIPIYDIFGKIDTSDMKYLLSLGYTKFVLPKLLSKDDFQLVSPIFEKKKVEIILLIETPRFLMEVIDVLLKFKPYIVGLGIGSHDLMSAVGGIHSLQNLEYPRQQILYLARLIDVKAIDFASMELSDTERFETELIDGFQKGYDGKFLIHPWQLKILRNTNFYTLQDYMWALSINEKLDQVGKPTEFSPIIIDGQVIEKMHLKKVNKILQLYKK